MRVLPSCTGEPPMIELITGKGGNLLQVRARPHCRVV
jgi:hypothetical protein